MCRSPGTGMLRLDRERNKLHGVVSCGCGERSVPIAETADGRLTLGIDYRPQPELPSRGGESPASDRHRGIGR